MTLKIVKTQRFIVSDGDDGIPGGAPALPFPDAAKIEALPNGGFVAAWSTTDFLGRDVVRVAWFGEQGVQQGNTQLVYRGQVAEDMLPDLAVLKNGNVVVAWDGIDSNQTGVFARVYGDDQIPRGPAFQVNVHETSDQSDVAVTALSGGAFQVAWSTSGQEETQDEVYTRRYTADGVPLKGEYRVNTESSLFQTDPDVMTLPGPGNFLTAYTDTSAGDVNIRIEGNDVDITLYKNLDRAVKPALVQLSDDRFAVAFEGHDAAGSPEPEAYDDAILGVQPYGPDGAPGPRFVQRGTEDLWLEDLSVTGLADGGFVAAWEGRVMQAGVHVRSDIFVTRVDATGTPFDEPLQMPRGLGTPYLMDPEIISLENGNLALTYTARANFGFSNKEEGIKLVMLFSGLVGTSGADQFVDKDGVNELDGRAGDDYLRGLAGADLIKGGIGRDTLEGGLGNDSLLGEAGDDAMAGGRGDDEIRGGKGNDYIIGSFGRDVIYGGPGVDWMQGGPSRDRLEGGPGNDTLVGGLAIDRFVFSRGDDIDKINDFLPGKDKLVLNENLWQGDLTPLEVLHKFGRMEDGDYVLGFGLGDMVRLSGVEITAAELANDLIIV